MYSKKNQGCELYSETYLQRYVNNIRNWFEGGKHIIMYNGEERRHIFKHDKKTFFLIMNVMSVLFGDWNKRHRIERIVVPQTTRFFVWQRTGLCFINVEMDILSALNFRNDNRLWERVYVLLCKHLEIHVCGVVFGKWRLKWRVQLSVYPCRYAVEVVDV